MSERYRVFYYSGSELTLKTRVLKGEAWIDSAYMNIEGPDGKLLIEAPRISGAELFRLHGLGRVIRIEYGATLFISVVRFMIGQFALINFPRTGKFHRELLALINDPRS